MASLLPKPDAERSGYLATIDGDARILESSERRPGFYSSGTPRQLDSRSST